MTARRALLATLAVLALTGCQPGDFELPSAAPTTPPVTSGPMPDYDRGAFDHWSDLDDDGCDTREEILVRDAQEYTIGADGCVDEVTVLGPYTGEQLVGRAAIDVDHVVALSDAWRSGAWRWTDGRREVFANDEANLLATQDNENQSKGGDGPDEWRPPREDFWCEYATIYRDVKLDYELEITMAQAGALAELLQAC